MIARFASLARCCSTRSASCCSRSRSGKPAAADAPADRRGGRPDRRPAAGSSMRSTCSRQGKAKRLLIAGADPSVTKADLARRIPRQRAGCSNAASISAANPSTPAPTPKKRSAGSTEHHFKSLRLITSDWHMRRARYEFDKVLGAQIPARHRRRCGPSRASSPCSASITNIVLRRARGLGRHLMAAAAVAAVTRRSSTRRRCCGCWPASSRSLFGRRPTLAVVLSWARFPPLAGRATSSASARRSKGDIPAGPYLIAVKHQSMFETIEMVRLPKLPVIVIKRELADIPLFGWLTRRYGVIPVDRERRRQGAARTLVAEGKAGGRDRAAGDDLSRRDAGSASARRRRCARASPGSIGRSACRSCRSRSTAGACGAGACSTQPGTVTFKVGETIPAGPQARRDRSARARRDQCARTSSCRRAPSFSAAATIRLRDFADLLVGEALLARLERDFDRERQPVGRLEAVEQPDVGDRRFVGAADRAEQIVGGQSAGTRKAKSRVTACSAGGA